MPVVGLVLRADKGSPLTIAEMDQNLTLLRDFSNAQETLFLLVINKDGTLKVDTVPTNALQDGAVKKEKVNGDVAGDGLLKALTADPLSVNVDDSTIEVHTDGTIRVKPNSLDSTHLKSLGFAYEELSTPYWASMYNQTVYGTDNPGGSANAWKDSSAEAGIDGWADIHKIIHDDASAWPSDSTSFGFADLTFDLTKLQAAGSSKTSFDDVAFFVIQAEARTTSNFPWGGVGIYNPSLSRYQMAWASGFDDISAATVFVPRLEASQARIRMWTGFQTTANALGFKILGVI